MRIPGSLYGFLFPLWFLGPGIVRGGGRILEHASLTMGDAEAEIRLHCRLGEVHILGAFAGLQVLAFLR